ncbi:uncharacterized protein [Magallana gigas]|uniref:uncharacterized protein n=1 Tax=Magallana gigas TaxID=29159 RepID=UPI003340222E
MAAAVHSGVPQQPLNNKRDEEIINSISSLILFITGSPPVNANHVYCFMQYMYNFLHPFPTLRNNTGGTLPTPFLGQPIAESLQGWEDVPHQDLNFVQNVFQFIPADDQKLAYDHFFQKLGKYT